jgi:FAD/FMN-containing dehydrogenase
MPPVAVTIKPVKFQLTRNSSVQVTINKLTFNGIAAAVSSATVWPQTQATDSLLVDFTIQNTSQTATIPAGSAITASIHDDNVTVMWSGAHVSLLDIAALDKSRFLECLIGQSIAPAQTVSASVALEWNQGWQPNPSSPTGKCALSLALWEPSSTYVSGDVTLVAPPTGVGTGTVSTGPGSTPTSLPGLHQYYHPELGGGGCWVDVSPSPCQTARLGVQSPIDSVNAWEDWTKTFTFKPTGKYMPRSAAEVAAAILSAEAVSQPLRAVGSGWSFSDAAIPLPDATSVKAATEDPALTSQGISSPALPSSSYILDTSHLASSLQDNLANLLSVEARNSGRHFYHVQAGIKVADLDVLLDHESPPLALDSRGGSNGQALAGAFSTGTHGGEFGLKPLADYVRAIHLIGPRAVEYWIERSHDGKNLAMTTPAQVCAAYPCIDPSHVIYDTATFQAVMVSMGCMGVIYSVILEAVPQFGIRQLVHTSTWTAMVKEASGPDKSGKVNAAAFGTKLMDGSWQQPALAGPNTFVGLTVNPYPDSSGDFQCWLANRERLAMPVVPSGGSDPVSMACKALSDVLKAAPSPVEVAKIGAFATALGVKLAGKSIPADLGTLLGQLVSFAQSNGYDWLLRALTQSVFTSQLPVDKTDVSYTFSSAGFLTAPMAAASIEIAFPVNDALHFLEDVVFDIMKNSMVSAKQYIAGWISLRICGQTDALLGMERFAPTAFIEVSLVASPAASSIIGQLQTKAIAAGGILHWGQANDQLTSTIVQKAYTSQAITDWQHYRQVFGHAPGSIFNNNFTARCGL